MVMLMEGVFRFVCVFGLMAFLAGTLFIVSPCLSSSSVVVLADNIPFNLLTANYFLPCVCQWWWLRWCCYASPGALV